MKPILFSTAMVEAILDGRKKMTRRVIKMPPRKIIFEDGNWLGESGRIYNPPYGNIGDVIWVRETWQHTSNLGINNQDENAGYIYKASENGKDWEENTEGWKWKPSIFMPRDACRLFLKITNIRAERLQDISEQDSIDEGIIDRRPFGYSAFGIDQCEKANLSFKFLWETINGKDSWNNNPLVWVIEFEKQNK